MNVSTHMLLCTDNHKTTKITTTTTSTSSTTTTSTTATITTTSMTAPLQPQQLRPQLQQLRQLRPQPRQPQPYNYNYNHNNYDGNLSFSGRCKLWSRIGHCVCRSNGSSLTPALIHSVLAQLSSARPPRQYVSLYEGANGCAPVMSTMSSGGYGTGYGTTYGTG